MPPFRVAPEATSGRYVTWTLLQTAFFWSLFLGVIPAGILSIEHLLGWPAYAVPRVIALMVFLLCSALGLTSGVIMAIRGRGTPLPLMSPRRLVVIGPYRYIRNPMAVAGLGQALAIGLWFGSWGMWLYVVTGFLVWNGWVRQKEEADLELRFGDAFRHYRAHVHCWIPRWTPYRGDDAG